jgi:N-methylhydantoinase B/oxoprolinase/acetone carboxylase alpha subunit
MPTRSATATQTGRGRSSSSRSAGRTLVNGEEISGKDTRALEAGDLVRIETPGGGGFGAPGG